MDYGSKKSHTRIKNHLLHVVLNNNLLIDIYYIWLSINTVRYIIIVIILQRREKNGVIRNFR